MAPPRFQPSADKMAHRAFRTMSQLTWGVTGLLLLVTGALLETLPITIEPSRLPLNALTFAVFGATGIIYTYIRFDLKVAAVCDAIALLSAFATVGAVYTYAATTLGAAVPFHDASMLAADHALGLDWRRYLAWMDAHPILGRILDQSYRSILWQVAVVIAGLVIFGQERRLQTFLLAVQLTLLVCGAAPALVPALGAYSYLQINPALDHPHISLTLMNGPIPQILQLRGATPYVKLDEIAGIVVFPSFHMASAVLLTWACWRLPLLRWPVLALNLAMAAATPLSGGHYFVDLMAGTALAASAIVAAKVVRAMVDRRTARPAARPQPPVVQAPASI